MGKKIDPRCIVSDKPLTPEDRDMHGFDCVSLASYFFTQNWAAVFNPEPSKTNKQERVDAFHLFTDKSGYWYIQRMIWAESYLDMDEAIVRRAFLKEYKEKKHELNMPVVALKKNSINRLEVMLENYDALCELIEVQIRYFEKNTFTYKIQLPKLMKVKKKYDKIFRWILKEDWVNPIRIKLKQEVNTAAEWYKQSRIQGCL